MVLNRPTSLLSFRDCFIKQLEKLNTLRFLLLCAREEKKCTILTVIAMSPRKQISDVFVKTCNIATKENSLSIFSENVITLLCLLISIAVVDSTDPS